MVRPDRSRYFTLAHRYVSTAIYNGDLPRLDGSIPCEDCGKPAQEYDHRDYKKPMEVAAVCKACNAARGPGRHRDPSETGVKPRSIKQRFLGGDYRKRPVAPIAEPTILLRMSDYIGPPPSEPRCEPNGEGSHG